MEFHTNDPLFLGHVQARCAIEGRREEGITRDNLRWQASLPTRTKTASGASLSRPFSYARIAGSTTLASEFSTQGVGL